MCSNHLLFCSNHAFIKGNPFFKCIAQIALAPPLCQTGTGEHFLRTLSFSFVFLHCQNELESAQMILASVLTPPKARNCQFGCGKKCSKPSEHALTPPPPYGQCPYGNNIFKKGASLCNSRSLKVLWSSVKVADGCQCWPMTTALNNFLQKKLPSHWLRAGFD